MSSLVKFVEEQFVEKKELPSFSSGDTITVTTCFQNDCKTASTDTVENEIEVAE